MPYIFIRSEAHAGAQPCLRYLVIRSWTIANLAPSVRSVKIPHSCGSFGFHSLPPFPRPYTTTYPVPVAPRPTREHLDSEITLSPLVVLTDWLPSLPLRRLVGLFRCRFDQCNVQACALAACTASVISTNDVAYLPGLPLRVPRRLRKVQDSNLRCLKERSLLRFTSLSIAPAFDHSANLPNMSILIVLFVLETRELRSGLGMNKYKMFN